MPIEGLPPTGGPAKPSFMQGAAEAKTNFASEQAIREAKKEQFFRFALKPGEKALITFLDGSLSPNGLLEPGGGFYYEHTVPVGGGKWDNFVCLREIEGFCPMCAGDSARSYVAYFTVLDHRTHTGQRGTYVDQKKLYVAKGVTYEKLQVRAAKNLTGLVGATITVMRGAGNKTPRVGDDFDIDEVRSLMEIHGAYPKSKVNEPTNYAKQIVPVSGADLLARGIGVAQEGQASSPGNVGASAPAEVPDPSSVPF